MGEGFDFKETIKIYTKNWYWFLISVIVGLVIGFLTIRYSTPMYEAFAVIQILDEEDSNSTLSVFQDLDVFGKSNKVVEDEIEILNSASKHAQAVTEMKLNSFIIEMGDIKNTERYENPPFKVNYIAADSLIQESSFFFRVRPVSREKLEYYELSNDDFKLYSFGQSIPSPIGDLVITPLAPLNDSFASQQGKTFMCVLAPVYETVGYYQANTDISMISEESSIVYIQHKDNSPKKAKEYLKKLLEIYNRNYLEDKKELADATSNFIDNRIVVISGNLNSADNTAQDFKTGKGLTDIGAETNLNLSIGAQNQQELQAANNELNVVGSMKDIIDGQDGYKILPANIGLSDPSIGSITKRYNELVAERNRLLKSSNDNNPIIVNLDQELNGLKRSMQSSLNNIENSLSLQVNGLSKRQSIINSRIYSAPKNERVLRDITRRQQTTEELYIYLLQKREEAQIAAANSAPRSKILDPVQVGIEPIEPNTNVIYLASIIFGLLLPFSVIYLRDLLDNKVHGKDQLEKVLKSKIPVIGELPRLSKNKIGIVQDNDRSVLAESLRILRTNLSYILSSKKIGFNEGAIIYVTSSVPGEGKTFVASNLAKVFSTSKNKVLLLGADIRNPKIYEFYEGGLINQNRLKNTKRNEQVGLTDFLVDSAIDVKDIISKSKEKNAPDLIYSGKIPPNPVEVLSNDRLFKLFEKLRKEYDYIIVDTAPIIAVTDTVLISGMADSILYVSRAGVTDISILDHPMTLHEEGKLPNLVFVVNSVKESYLGYGGKYGYGYGQVKKKWWRFSKS